MITAKKHEFITLRDEMYVNGKRVYEVYVNGTRVYPDGGGDTMYIIDFSNSMMPYVEKTLSIVDEHNFGKSYTLCTLSNDETIKVIIQWTTSFEEIVDAIKKKYDESEHVFYYSFKRPSTAIISSYEEYQPNSIVIISDESEFRMTDEDAEEIDSLMGASNLYLFNLKKSELTDDQSELSDDQSDSG